MKYLDGRSEVAKAYIKKSTLSEFADSTSKADIFDATATLRAAESWNACVDYLLKVVGTVPL